MKKSGAKGTLATLPAEITATIFHPARLWNLKRQLLLVEIVERVRIQEEGQPTRLLRRLAFPMDLKTLYGGDIQFLDISRLCMISG